MTGNGAGMVQTWVKCICLIIIKWYDISVIKGAKFRQAVSIRFKPIDQVIAWNMESAAPIFLVHWIIKTMIFIQATLRSPIVFRIFNGKNSFGIISKLW